MRLYPWMREEVLNYQLLLTSWMRELAQAHIPLRSVQPALAETVRWVRDYDRGAATWRSFWDTIDHASEACNDAYKAMRAQRTKRLENTLRSLPSGSEWLDWVHANELDPITEATLVLCERENKGAG